MILQKNLTQINSRLNRWEARLVCDPGDPLTADLLVEGSPIHHEIRITIWGSVGPLDDAIAAAQVALEAYADTIAQAGRRVA
ncbi:hypothetical protein HNI00_21940 [Thermoleptolyngbya oregonensis NK1-22]|uniref:Uncharacterized protein n=1 Tax=Thermoleptolyngbya oregonensis NK1-22 TaxID=2547457 RepID=A0AA96Y712_9CYAN|nr:hypothetical protein [Thermoleptolyngbya oregonensis]WOB45496.1 hypothetical protein HNI00_21940 [Thermoleptolyngbya oregonensis NK1-22]